MAKIKKSTRVRVDWTRIIVVLILGFFLVETSLAFERKFVLQHEIRQRLLNSQSELERLRAENLSLRQEKEALYRPEKIEELAREKLGLTKPHEIAVEVIKKSSPDEAIKQGNPQSPSKSLWEKLKEELPVKWLLKLGPS